MFNARLVNNAEILYQSFIIKKQTEYKCRELLHEIISKDLNCQQFMCKYVKLRELIDNKKEYEQYNKYFMLYYNICLNI